MPSCWARLAASSSAAFRCVSDSFFSIRFRASRSWRMASPSAEFGTMPTASTTRSASISTRSPRRLSLSFTESRPPEAVTPSTVPRASMTVLRSCTAR